MSDQLMGETDGWNHWKAPGTLVLLSGSVHKHLSHFVPCLSSSALYPCTLHSHIHLWALQESLHEFMGVHSADFTIHRYKVQVKPVLQMLGAWKQIYKEKRENLTHAGWRNKSVRTCDTWRRQTQTPHVISRGVSDDPTLFIETHQAACNNLLLVWICRYTQTLTWCLHESFYSWASQTYIPMPFTAKFI